MIDLLLERFPELKDELEEGEPGKSDRTTLAKTLAAAEAELNPSIWGKLFEEGVLFLAADKLTRCRLGESLRDQENPAAKSLYAIEFERLSRIVSMGARVI